MRPAGHPGWPESTAEESARDALGEIYRLHGRALALLTSLLQPIVARHCEALLRLLVPPGSKLVGSYQSASVLGQERVQISWERVIFPNASSIELAGMPGADPSGYVGFTDQIDHHSLQIFGTVLLMSTISAGQMVGHLTAFGSGTNSPYGYAPPSQWALTGEAACAGASGQFGQVGQQSLLQGMNRPPTLKIRAVYEFNVMVTRDLVLAGPYKG